MCGAIELGDLRGSRPNPAVQSTGTSPPEGLGGFMLCVHESPLNQELVEAYGFLWLNRL